RIGTLHAIGIRRLKSIPRDQQQRSVQLVSIKDAHVALQLLVPCARADLITQVVALARKPFYGSAAEEPVARHSRQSVERGPAHEPRISMVSAITARLPNPFIG